MPPPKKPDGKPAVVTVKIEAAIHSQAKKIAAFTGETIEEILSSALRDPIAKRLRKILIDASKPTKEDDQ